MIIMIGMIIIKQTTMMMMCESHNKKSEHGQRECSTRPPAKEVVEKSNQLTSSLVARHPVIMLTIMAIVVEFSLA